MCIMSGVYDHFGRDRWFLYPTITTGTGTFETKTAAPFTPEQIAEIEKLIKDFTTAKEAAKVIDDIMGEADCLDMDKAKLDARVKELEAEIKRLKKQARDK